MGDLVINAVLPWTPPARRLKAGSDRFDLSERRCIGHRRHVTDDNGEKAPCQNFAIRGMRVCRFHGGSSMSAKNAAKARLLAMVEPAFGVLYEVMQNPNAEDSDRIKAANSVLDRAGFSAKMQLTVKDKRDDVETMTRDQLLSRGARIMELLDATKHDVIDGVVEHDAQQGVRP